MYSEGIKVLLSINQEELEAGRIIYIYIYI